MREALYQAGDDLSKSRPIDHFVVFTTPERIDAFAAKMRGFGFQVEDPTSDPDTNTISLQLIRNDSPNHIDQLTYDLKVLAADFGATYDGWASIVVK